MKTSSRRIGYLILAVGLLIGGISVLGRAQESKEKKTTAPKAVLDAFHKSYPNATIKDVSKEDKDGKEYFEIESLDGTQERNILYQPDGTVFEIEESIAVANLPTTVVASLRTAFPDWKARKAEKITRGQTVEYELLLAASESRLEVLLDANGKVKSQTKISEDDDEEEDD